MTWRVAHGLDRLLDQINAEAPGRSKESDGSIGDPAHRKERSDHNPDQGTVVRARDFTHDRDHGADMHKIAEALRRSRDPRISYVIFNRRIFSGAGGDSPWKWRTYRGKNPHDKHMHVSVVAGRAADDTSDWQIGEDDMPSLDEIRDVLREELAREMNGPLPKTASVDPKNTTRLGATWHTYQRTGRIEQAVAGIRGDLAAALGRDPVDEAALAQVLWGRLGEQTVEEIAQILRAGMTPEKLAELAARLGG